MIPNSVTNETAHVTNWILYSGCIDLDAVMAEAEADAKASDAWNDVEANDTPAEILFFRNELLTDALSETLEAAFYAALAEVSPYYADNFYGEPIWGDVCGLEEDEYRNGDPEFFFLTLMAPAIDRISFGKVAALVREHVAKSLATA